MLEYSCAGDFLALGYDQLLQLTGSLSELRILDYRVPTSPAIARYMENVAPLFSGWVDANDDWVVGDFLGLGHDQVLFFNKTDSADGRVLVADFSGGKPPAVVRYWENWGDSPLLDGWQDANDDRLAGDFLSLGHDQVMFFNKTDSGDGRVLIADFSSGKPPAVVGYWENWGDSPLLDGWQDANDDRVAGDFLGLGHDQVMFFNKTDSGDGRVLIADFSGGKPPAVIRYWENWGDSPLLDGWQDANDDRVAGDFLGLGHDQVMFFNKTDSGDGRVLIADFSSGKPPAVIRYWENWGDSPLLNGWQDSDDRRLPGDFCGLGHQQVMFQNAFHYDQGRIMVADFAVIGPPARVAYWDNWPASPPPPSPPPPKPPSEIWTVDSKTVRLVSFVPPVSEVATFKIDSESRSINITISGGAQTALVFHVATGWYQLLPAVISYGLPHAGEYRLSVGSWYSGPGQVPAVTVLYMRKTS